MRAVRHGVTVLLATVAVSGACAAPLTANSGPYLPLQDGQVLAHVPPGTHHEDVAVRKLARGRLDVALPLAQFYIGQARSSGDLRYLGYAESMVAPWLDKRPTVPMAWVLEATVQQSRHDFSAALRSLDTALAANAADPQAWLTRATVLRVLGRLPQARASCERFANLTDAATGELCTLGIDGMGERLPSAYRALQNLPLAGLSEAERSWRSTELGEMAVRLGLRAQAVDWFRDALSHSPHDFYVLAALADVMLADNRPQDVVQLLAGQEGIEPLLLRLAIAQKQMRDPALLHSVAMLDEVFAAEQSRGQPVHRREQARYLLDVKGDPDQALAVALLNWDVQREPEDQLILVRAARAAHRDDVARRAMAGAPTLHLVDARLGAAGGKS